MNMQAVATVAGLEIRQRIRSTRWKVSLGILFGLISLIVFGSLYVTVATRGTFNEWSDVLLDIVVVLVLFIGTVGAPTISATSINGDRRDATLAVVQATPVTAWELTVGKFLGAWAASLALVGVALPYLILGIVIGPVPILVGIGGIVLIAVLMGCYCAIGLGFSALTSRPAASAMLTQAMVLLLLFGLPLAFGVTVPAVTSDERVTVTDWNYTSADHDTCVNTTAIREQTHTERTWWLLSPNPLVMVSDLLAVGTPRTAEPFDNEGGLLTMLADAVSSTRSGPDPVWSKCPGTTVPGDDRDYLRYVGHTWYIGLVVTIALGAAGLAVAARRLRVPAARLPRGVRIA